MRIIDKEVRVDITEMDIKEWIEHELGVKIKKINTVDSGKGWDDEGSDRMVMVIYVEATP